MEPKTYSVSGCEECPLFDEESRNCGHPSIRQQPCADWDDENDPAWKNAPMDCPLREKPLTLALR